MCWHRWREYKDLKNGNYYRICSKCGIAQEIRYDGFGPHYVTDESLCRTNSWIDKETFKLRYGLN